MKNVAARGNANQVQDCATTEEFPQEELEEKIPGSPSGKKTSAPIEGYDPSCPIINSPLAERPPLEGELAPPIVARPVGISMVCSCGAGWPSNSTWDWQAELAEHVKKRHPQATALRLTLAAYPVEP